MNMHTGHSNAFTIPALPETSAVPVNSVLDSTASHVGGLPHSPKQQPLLPSHLKYGRG